MFGFVRPLVPELKVRELERFRAAYCGLCHELGREYGLAGQAILNYDFVFLAMLLWGEREDCGYEMRRCVPGFCRKRCVCRSCAPLTTAAGYSVILAYWKARDSATDARGLGKLPGKALAALMRRAYKRAGERHPGFDASVRERLGELSKLEAENSQSLDKTADRFASLLASASGAAEESSRRALEQVLYHVGRIIYIADAVYDLGDDRKSGSYNPVASRYSLDSDRLSDEQKEELLETLMGSARLAAAAFDLMPRSYWTPVTENILYLGIPDMIRAVLDGTYKTVMRGLPKSPVRPGGGESEA